MMPKCRRISNISRGCSILELSGLQDRWIPVGLRLGIGGLEGGGLIGNSTSSFFIIPQHAPLPGGAPVLGVHDRFALLVLACCLLAAAGYILVYGGHPGTKKYR